MTDSDFYARSLRLSNYLREPALLAAIQALQLPQGSWGLDAGCGIGLHTVRLAEAVGPTGHVTGIDLSPEFVVMAEDYAKECGLPERVSFREGDVSHLPFDDNTFDWVWAVDTAYPVPGIDPLSVIAEFARVVKPGGTVAILFWSAQKLLPGHPVLEAKLDLAFAQTALYMTVRSSLNFLRALGWLRETGLENCTAQTFVADVHAPLSDEIRSALTMAFQMFWGGMQSRLAPDDWAAFERLCQPESEHFILNQPDYYAFLTYSLFRGRVAGESPAVR